MISGEKDLKAKSAQISSKFISQQIVAMSKVHMQNSKLLCLLFPGIFTQKEHKNATKKREFTRKHLEDLSGGCEYSV